MARVSLTQNIACMNAFANARRFKQRVNGWVRKKKATITKQCKKDLKRERWRREKMKKKR